MQIQIKNYQSIKDATIQVEGITFLIGETDEGKSAVVRAVEGCLFNQRGDEFIQEGEKVSRVGIYFDADDKYENLLVAWQKNKNGSSFVVNGEPISKTGQRGPEEALETQGIRELVITKEFKLRLHFWNQEEPPILIKKTPSVIFEAISHIMEEYRLSGILRDMVKDSQEIEDSLKRVEGEIAAHVKGIQDRRRSLDVFKALDEFSPNTKRLTQLIERVQELARKLVVLRNISVDKSEKEVSKASWSTRKEELQGLVQKLSKEINRRDALSSCLTNLTALEEKITARSQRVGVYKKVSTLSSRLREVDSQRLQDLLSKRSRLASLAAQIQEQRARLTPLSEIREFRKRLDVVRLDRFKALIVAFKALHGSAVRLKSQKEALYEAKKKLEDAENVFTRYKETHKNCPLCGNLIDGN